MDAVEFFKTVNRLCKNRTCGECPIWKNGTCMADFGDDSVKSIEETISKVEQWAKDNPVKTRQSEFLKQFPSAFTSESVLQIQPCLIDKDIKLKYHTCFFYNCDDCKRKFWLTPIDESEEK